MRNAAKCGMMEVALGKLARKKGQSADVKKFGERMVTDQSKANNDLKAIAEKASTRRVRSQAKSGNQIRLTWMRW